MKNIKNADLNSLSVNQIDSYIDKLKELKERKNKTLEFVEKIKIDAENNGLCIDDITIILMGDKKNQKKKSPVKYSYTVNGETKTWSGLGKSPKWFNDYINNGGDVEEITVKS